MITKLVMIIISTVSPPESLLVAKISIVCYNYCILTTLQHQQNPPLKQAILSAYCSGSTELYLRWYCWLIARILFFLDEWASARIINHSNFFNTHWRCLNGYKMLLTEIHHFCMPTEVECTTNVLYSSPRFS